MGHGLFYLIAIMETGECEISGPLSLTLKRYVLIKGFL